MTADDLEDEPAPPALRRHFARHNEQALLLAVFGLIAAVALWGLLYLFSYWFTLVAVTVSRSMRAAPLIDIAVAPSQLVPHFFVKFVCVALAALGVAWLARSWARPEKLREAQYYFFWVLLELFLAVPNVTFSVWGNLSAVVKLSRREMAKAWRLLQCINAEGGRLSTASLRTVIDDERMLNRVLFALQLVGLVGMREQRDGGWFLVLQNEETMALLWPRHSAGEATPEAS